MGRVWGWSLGQVALGRGGTIYEVNYQRKKQSGRPRGGLAIHPGQGAVGKNLKQANLIFSSNSPPTPPQSHYWQKSRLAQFAYFNLFRQ